MHHSTWVLPALLADRFKPGPVLIYSYEICGSCALLLLLEVAWRNEVPTCLYHGLLCLNLDQRGDPVTPLRNMNKKTRNEPTSCNFFFNEKKEGFLEDLKPNAMHARSMVISYRYLERQNWSIQVNNQLNNISATHHFKWQLMKWTHK